MSLKQISVFVENKPGKMQTLTNVLADHQIDMRALSLAETSDFGIGMQLLCLMAVLTAVILLLNRRRLI